MLAALLAAIVVATWNGNWFPSGRAEHRAHPDVEAATSVAAARMLAQGLAAVDPAGTNDVILVLNEIRGPRAATNLIAQIGRKGLRMVSISGYRRRDRFDQQQDVIATTLPVAEANWSVWKTHQKETPPRGYAHAVLALDSGETISVYAVHFKSNYGATSPEERTLNAAKRSHAAEQLCQQEKKTGYVIVAGDLNVDPWRKEFAEEKTFGHFYSAGFANALAALPPRERGTHPHKRFGDSALDHILVRGFSVAGRPRIEPNDGLSDHYALFATVAPNAVKGRKLR